MSHRSPGSGLWGQVLALQSKGQHWGLFSARCGVSRGEGLIQAPPQPLSACRGLWAGTAAPDPDVSARSEDRRDTTASSETIMIRKAQHVLGPGPPWEGLERRKSRLPDCFGDGGHVAFT